MKSSRINVIHTRNVSKNVEDQNVASYPGLREDVGKDFEVDAPPHYTQGGVEVIDILETKLSSHEFIGYLRGSLLAYLFRAPHKGEELKDYKKAQWYLNRIIQQKENVCQIKITKCP